MVNLDVGHGRNLWFDRAMSLLFPRPLSGSAAGSPSLPVAAASGIGGVLAPDPSPPTAPHVAEAELFVNYLNSPNCPATNNNYKCDGAPNILTWGTPGRPETWFNQSQCASFITGLLRRSYPSIATDDYFRTWFGSVSPKSRTYRRVLAGPPVPHWWPV